MDEAVVGSNPIDPPRSSLESQVLSRELRNFLAVGLKTPDSRLMTSPGRLAETDQRRSEEPKSLARYQERPPSCQNRLRERAAINFKEKNTMFALKSPTDYKPLAT